jgi:nicotinate-nucleotide adenylyltransferase
MVALAVAGQPGLLVSDLEMDLTGPSYTVDTLDRMEATGDHQPGSLFFVTGADTFRDIGSWKAYPEVLDRCHFIVVSRPGSPAGGMRQAFPELAARMFDRPEGIQSAPGIFLVDASTSSVSSTAVRRAVAQGRSLEGLVPSRVAEHIARHALYGFQDDGETPQG